MKTRYTISLLILMILSGCMAVQKSVFPARYVSTPATDSLFSHTPSTDFHADWHHHKLRKGVYHRSKHFDNLFGGKQYLSVIEVDLKRADVDIAFERRGFRRVSAVGDSLKTLAVVNGGFFDTKVGGSVTFLKHNGVVQTTTKPKFNAFRENGALAISFDNEVDVIDRPTEGWERAVGYKTILSSGPMMIADFVVQQTDKNVFNTNRHPRTAISRPPIALF